MSANPYDPVTTTDSTQLADDDWGLNLPNIRYGSYGPSRFKTFCSFLRERARLLLIIGVIFVIGLVLISIIAVASNTSSGRKPTAKDKEKRWESPEMGVTFYPRPSDGSTVISFSASDRTEDNPVFKSMNEVTEGQKLGLMFYPRPLDGSTVISFSASDRTEDNPVIKSMDEVTEAYQLQHQFKYPYTDCTLVNNPPNRVCRLSNIHFGTECSKHKFWGYYHAMPCILLQLNLPNNVTIRPITRESLLWSFAENIIGNHNDSDFVPVTCRGKESKDRLILGTHGFDKFDDHPIQYFPPDGLPSFLYRERNTTLPFLKPAMMIHLTSLKDNTMVHIECTAWGQLFDFNGKRIDHSLLKTAFAVYLKP